MKKLPILIILGFLATSCSAVMVTRPTTSKYAPDGYTATGVVKYNTRGASFIVKRRREDAFKQMYDSCRGEYQITGEGPQDSFGVIASTQATFLVSRQFWNIAFQCL